MHIEKLYKNKQTQEHYVNKAREKYEQDCVKINGYTAQSSLVQGKDLDKVRFDEGRLARKSGRNASTRRSEQDMQQADLLA